MYIPASKDFFTHRSKPVPSRVRKLVSLSLHTSYLFGLALTLKNRKYQI